jgi:hypothetical protein
MADTETQIEEKAAPVATLGKVERINTIFKEQEETAEDESGEGGEVGKTVNSGEATVDKGEGAETESATEKVQEEAQDIEFPEEQKAAFFIKMGIEYNGD